MPNKLADKNKTSCSRLRRWLAVSGMAFLVMNAPAWIPGFCAALAACLLWLLICWRLPLEGKEASAVHPGCLVSALLLCIGFGCNFYNNWEDSGYMRMISDIIKWSPEKFVFLLTAVFVLFSTPAVGMILSYYLSAATLDYRSKKSDCSEILKGISSGKAVLILFVVYFIGIYAILRANFYYQDDISRAAFGYKQWDYFGRYLSTALATLIHTGDYLTDIAPLPQLLAVLILAQTSVLLLYVVYDRTSFTLWELAAVVPLGLNPYFLECLSFRFDAPYMAVSVLAAVLPLLYRNRSTLSYVFASLLGTVAVCTSYQPATGIFPMLVILLMLRDWKGRKAILPFCLKSVAGYGAGLVYFKLVMMKPADAGYVSNALPEIGELLPNTLQNLLTYYQLVLTDFKHYWLVLILLLIIGFVYVSVQTSKHGTLSSVGMALAALLMMGLLCFGIYPVLADTLFAPRAMYGFGVLIVLLGITAAEGNRISLKVPAAVLSWVFFVFSFTYGNALNLQKEYTDFRIEQVISDLNDMEIFQTGEPVMVQISGDIGNAPVLDNLPRDYEILDRLIPETFSGESDLAKCQFYNYYGLKNVIQDEDVDLREMNLPVLQTHMYHTIRGNEQFILVELEE